MQEDGNKSGVNWELWGLVYFALFLISLVLSGYLEWKIFEYIMYPGFLIIVIGCVAGVLFSMYHLVLMLYDKFFDIYLGKGKKAAAKAVILSVLAIPVVFLLGYLVSVWGGMSSIYHWR